MVRSVGGAATGPILFACGLFSAFTVAEGGSATYVVSSRKEGKRVPEDSKVRMNWLICFPC